MKVKRRERQTVGQLKRKEGDQLDRQPDKTETRYEGDDREMQASCQKYIIKECKLLS